MNCKRECAIVAVFGLAAQLWGSGVASVENVVRERAEALVEKPAVLGLAIGIVDGDKTYAVFVGHQFAGGPPPDERTLFEIGSVTKTFTGLLLAEAVLRGDATLDQPVAELLGPDVVVPKFEDRPIRLVDLATQSSGLPRLPTNIMFINPLNPYAHYQAADLAKFLAEYKLPRAPGKKYEYSNLGMGLLGNALAKQAGTSYEELVKERICGPLGVSDTTITLSQDQESRMASGVSTLGLPAMNWDFPALPGCGAIRSTLHDMLIYLRANVAPESTPLAKAIAFEHEPRLTIREADAKSPNKLEIGLAWHITTENGNQIIWHNGMTGGYAAFVAVVPTKKWGEVVLGNTATSEIDNLGNGLLKDLLAGKLPASESPASTNSADGQPAD
jgi:D-alanyl-D-alanine-carboxypeptidase/D-alanyl-D-alanine-endopeptidase